MKKPDAVLRLERLLAERPDVVKATAVRLKFLSFIETNHEALMMALLEMAQGKVKEGQTGDSLKAQAAVLTKLIDKILVSTADRPTMGPNPDAGNGPTAVIFNLNGCDGGMAVKRAANDIARDAIDAVTEAVNG